MRIAYLLGEDLEKHPGLKYKIEKQIDCWELLGHTVYKVMHKTGIVTNSDGEVVFKREPLKLVCENSIALLRRLSWQYGFVVDSLKEINPDLTYSRYLFPSLNVYKIPRFAGKFVVEINSNDRYEYLQKSKYTGFYNSFFRGFSLRGAHGLVFVTEELANSSDFCDFSFKRTVIANGVEVTDYDFCEDTGNDSPQLVFIGSPGQTWHGLDKLGVIAEKIPHCTMHIAGPDRQECEEKWGYLPENVICHGYLSGGEVQKLVLKMDVGIGTLALHRKKMNEACPLKTRQYFAQGLPVVGASKDTDINGSFPFYLELPNSENNVVENIGKIEGFIAQVHRNRLVRNSARKFGEHVLSIEKKETVRVRFFEDILSS
ncbi:hypothetical protein KQ940_15210 [Marinobacterium sp. D7]|uniref:hypothetical protein n=1 Tax=Marinobacterium ramblicola TaxID=2849041 RepID=UPI001C2D4233|nr:hypothetical protein [Marinobacterium ramblicola]MBV1789404.1 hypothetical protein [Marinobacterium ramblicola]